MVNYNFGLRNLGYSNFVTTRIYPRQRWYFYKEGFSSELVKLAIEKAQLSPDDLIIDPFNGSGTTTLTASILGYRSVGIEVNPFTSFLSGAKLSNVNPKLIDKYVPLILEGIHSGDRSDLINFSTFSKKEGLNKWLFNDSILYAFEGGWSSSLKIRNLELRKLMQLALLSSAMENCNAKKDGKGLKYKSNWQLTDFNKSMFLKSFSKEISKIKDDLESNPITNRATIVNTDVRGYFKNAVIGQYKLCITSPPYLNTFDYTDIYRPELFLGKFVKSPEDLYKLRMRTMRSHIQAKWELPVDDEFGVEYHAAMDYIYANQDKLMHRNIPIMIQAYFEDMRNLLVHLKKAAAPGAQIWIVVANSAYADKEVPVDLIIGEIGEQIGFVLKEIGVLRLIQKRKTKYSPNVDTMRESVIIFQN